MSMTIEELAEEAYKVFRTTNYLNEQIYPHHDEFPKYTDWIDLKAFKEGWYAVVLRMAELKDELPNSHLTGQ